MVAPPGSGSQAPGQLVAISSIDYLVVMPSGARALSPAPQETLLAGVRGPLGLKHVNACMVSVGAACVCVHARVCAVGLQLSLLAPRGNYTCGHVCVSAYARADISVGVHTQVHVGLYPCVLRIRHLCWCMSRDVFLWVHMCLHMCLCASVYGEDYRVCVCKHKCVHVHVKSTHVL